MSRQPNPYPLRIDNIVMGKFKYIAKENGRSVNKEIEIILKDVILKYEKENGTICFDEGKDKQD